MKEGVEIPFLPSSKIKIEADNLRNKHWKESIPVDIEKIIEFKMGIEIRPVSHLKSVCDVEAAIFSDWRTICVDRKSYEDDRCFTRVRFSLAHEIGHFVLHNKIYSELNIKSFEDYKKFIDYKNGGGCNFYENAEVQAGIFANIFLVPREELLVKKKQVIKKVEKQIPNINELIQDKNLLNSYLAKPLANSFFVSEDVMAIALNYLESDLKQA